MTRPGLRLFAAGLRIVAAAARLLPALIGGLPGWRGERRSVHNRAGAGCLGASRKIARHIVTKPPVAVRLMKEFAIRFGDLPTDQAWHVQALINSLLIRTTTDGKEGHHAFNEKRPPRFNGALRRRGKVIFPRKSGRG